MVTTSDKRCVGFSLIELVIVVVILGILGAILAPRVSRFSENAAFAALAYDLAALNRAVDRYAVEHGRFPDLSTVATQLTQMTDANGSTGNGSEVIFGPYLHAIPPLTIGARKGQNGIAAADAPDVGWLYDADAGVIRPNLKGSDAESDDALVNRIIAGSNIEREQLVKDE